MPAVTAITLCSGRLFCTASAVGSGASQLWKVLVAPIDTV